MKKELLLIALLASTSMALQAMAKNCAGRLCEKTSNAAYATALCCLRCKQRCDRKTDRDEIDGIGSYIGGKFHSILTIFACWSRQKAINLQGGVKLDQIER